MENITLTSTDVTLFVRQRLSFMNIIVSSINKEIDFIKNRFTDVESLGAISVNDQLSKINEIIETHQYEEGSEIHNICKNALDVTKFKENLIVSYENILIGFYSFVGIQINNLIVEIANITSFLDNESFKINVVEITTDFLLTKENITNLINKFKSVIGI